MMDERPQAIAWPQLMRLGMLHLGLVPDVFWSLSPAELMFLAGGGQGSNVFSRSSLDELMAQYPDGETDGGD